MLTSLREALFRETIDAYSQGRLDEGREACERLLSMASMDERLLTQTLRNEVFYARRLSAISPSLLRADIGPSAEGLIACDPSLAVSGDHLFALIDEREGRDAPRLRRTVAAAVLDSAGVVASRGELAVDAVEPVGRCRMVATGGGAAVVCGRSLPGPAAAIFGLDVETGRLGGSVIVQDGGGDDGLSWMPFERNGELLILTRCQPARVVRVLVDGGIEVLSEVVGPPIMGRLEGASPGIRVSGGWLFAVRQVAFFEDGTHVTLHRFAGLGDDFAWTNLTEPFRFGDGDDRNERCTGLAMIDDRLYAGVGVEDLRATVCSIAVADLQAMLKPISKWADPAVPSEPLPAIRLADVVGVAAAPAPRLVPPRTVREAALAALLDARSSGPDREQARRETAVAVSREISESLDDALVAVADPAAWFREARDLLAAGDWQAAREACLKGMAVDAGMAELPWLAAFACWTGGDDEGAIAYASQAAALGWLGGRTAPEAPEVAGAWFEGPADIIRYAARRSGLDAAAEREYEAAREARLAWEAARAVGDASGDDDGTA